MKNILVQLICMPAVKDRQQVITAVLPRSPLNAHYEFAPKPIHYNYISLKRHFYMLFHDINHRKMVLRGLM